MKKIFKILGFLFLGILSLVLLLVVYLSIAGFPKPAQLEVRNINKASFGQMTDIMGLMSYQNVFYELIRTEGDQVIFRKNGQTFRLNTADSHVTPYQGHIPKVGLFGQMQYRDGHYYYLEENRNTEDRILMKMEEQSGVADTLITGFRGLYDFKISKDGKLIVAVDQDDQSGNNLMYQFWVNPESKPEVVFENSEIMSVQEFGPDRKSIVINKILVDGTVTYYNLNLADKVISAFEPVIDSATYSLSNPARIICDLQVFTTDFNTSYFVRSGSAGLSKEFNTLFAKQKDSVWQVSPPMAADVNHLVLSPDEQFLVFSANAGGFGKIFAIDRDSNEILTVYDQQEFNLNWFNSSPFFITSDNQVVFAVTNYSGGKLLMHNLASGEQSTVDESISEELRQAMKFTAFSYPTSDDSVGNRSEIPAYLYMPTSSSYEKLPVVIDLHGGPEMPAFPYAINLGPYFINKGIAVIAPDYRGSTGYGYSFAHADDFDNRPKQVEDIKHLLEWIKTQPDLDSEKVMLIGQSHGGFMVMAALAQYPEVFLGGVSIAGVSDFSLVMHENNFHSRWYKHEFGDFTDPTQKAVIDSISPLTHAASITEPLFLMHGTADPRVVYQNSQKMAEAIDAAGGRVRYIQAEGAGHGVEPDGPLSGLFMMSAILDFIEELVEN